MNSNDSKAESRRLLNCHEVIAVLECQGLKILAHGYEMLRYPDNCYASGYLITAMGTEALAPRMLWLNTNTGVSNRTGTNRVTYDVAPTS